MKQKQGFRKVKRECGWRHQAWGYKCPFEVSVALDVGRGLPEAGSQSSVKRKQGGPITWCHQYVIFKLLLSSPGIRHFILCPFWSVLKFTSNASGYWPLKNYFCWKHLCPPSHSFEAAFSSVPQTVPQDAVWERTLWSSKSGKCHREYKHVKYPGWTDKKKL